MRSEKISIQSQSLEEIIGQAGKFLHGLLFGEYTAILLLGSAARNEVSFGPDGTILSDLDFLVVLPQKNRVTASRKEHQCRAKLRDFERDFYKKHLIPITIGFANASAKCWMPATPMMLELRENGRVLYGDTSVKNWPAIKKNYQIPSWEGIRLIANRICELLGVIGHTPIVHSDLVYASLKMVLACSEAHLIDNQIYRTSYRNRLEQYCATHNSFSDRENNLILSAYRAKLGQDMSFYAQDAFSLAQDVLQLGISILSGHRLYGKQDWEKRNRLEQPGLTGLDTDILFFLQNLVNGKIVPIRHPILRIYTDAVSLASKAADKNNQFINNHALKDVSLMLFEHYKTTPQCMSIIHNQKP